MNRAHAPSTRSHRATTQPPRAGRRLPFVQHQQMRQGDEYACSCGARWELGEGHPVV